MAKSTKAERAARDAVEHAHDVAKRAKKTTRTLPKKSVREVAPYLEEAKAAADVSRKKLTSKPRKTAERAERAARRLEKAVAKAVDKAERKALARLEAQRIAEEAQHAERIAAEHAAEAKRLKKQGRAAERAAARAETESAAAAAALEQELAAPADVVAEVTAEPAGEPAPAPASVEELPADDLPARTVVQLRSAARAAGHTGYSRLTKAQLIDLLS